MAAAPTSREVLVTPINDDLFSVDVIEMSARQRDGRDVAEHLGIFSLEIANSLARYHGSVRGLLVTMW